MVVTIDGTKEICAYLRSNLCYLNSLRHLIRSREVTYPVFLHACATCSELPSNIGKYGFYPQIQLNFLP